MVFEGFSRRKPRGGSLSKGLTLHWISFCEVVRKILYHYKSFCCFHSPRVSSGLVFFLISLMFAASLVVTVTDSITQVLQLTLGEQSFQSAFAFGIGAYFKLRTANICSANVGHAINSHRNSWILTIIEICKRFEIELKGRLTVQAVFCFTFSSCTF